MASNYESEDSFPEFLISPCFAIGPNVELKEIPSTGEEYLLKVMDERRHCPAVTKCNKDYSIYAKNQTRFVEECPLAVSPDVLKPTIEWQNIQVADFLEIRMYIFRLKSHKSLWWDKVETEIDLFAYQGWRRVLLEKDPTLSNIIKRKEDSIDAGLQTVIEIMDDIPHGKTFDERLGRWTYSLIACTKEHPSSDTYDILRKLARKCAEVRSRINPEQEDAATAVAPLNLFICLVSRYFKQYDLADKSLGE